MGWPATARSVQAALAFGLACAVTACGGGGGGGGGVVPNLLPARTPLPLVRTDTLPVGTRIDVAADDFFIFVAGDRATYRATTFLGVSIEVQREVVAGPDAQGTVTIVENVPAQPGIESSTERWQRRADGLWTLDFLGQGGPAGFSAVVGDTLLYPTPFYPVGSLRTLVRQGDLGADLDGDQIPESFRLELRQTFVGFETGTRGGRAERRARFQNHVTLTVQPSRADVPILTSVLTEESLFAAHTGLIQSHRTAVVDGNNIADYNGLEGLFGGTLAGRDVNIAWNAGTARYLAMKAYDLLFEPLRGHYYAGLGQDDASHPGGVVARIDPATSDAIFSAPLGNDVRSIAVSADGQSLYAGVWNQAEIVRLSLPDLQVQQRIAIRPGSWAFSLAVSPVDPTVVAYFPDSSGSGLTLLRDGVVQPRTPGFFDVRPDSTANPALFSPDGASLFMYGTTPTSSNTGLLRVPVLSDGFAAMAQDGGLVFGRTLSLSDAGLVAGTGLYRTSDMLPLGSTAVSLGISDCRPLRGVARWACVNAVGEGRAVAVVDAATFALIEDGRVPLPPTSAGVIGGSLIRVVPGPIGQVALMLGSSFYSDSIALFDNRDFR